MSPGLLHPDIGHDDGALRGFLGVGVFLDDRAENLERRLVLLHLRERSCDQVGHLLPEGIVGIHVDVVGKSPHDVVVGALAEEVKPQADEDFAGKVLVVGPALEAFLKRFIGLFRVLHLAVALGDPVKRGLRPGIARKLVDVGPELVHGLAVQALAVETDRFGIKGLVLGERGALELFLGVCAGLLPKGLKLERLGKRKSFGDRVAGTGIGSFSQEGMERRSFPFRGCQGCLLCCSCDFDLGVRLPVLLHCSPRRLRCRGFLPGRCPVFGPGKILLSIHCRKFPDGKKPDHFFLLELCALACRFVGAVVPADKDTPSPIPSLGFRGKGVASFFLQDLDLFGGLFCARVGSHMEAVCGRGFPRGGCGCGKEQDQDDGQTGDVVFSHGQSRCAEIQAVRWTHHRLTGR